MIKYFDIFAGIGGFRSGLEKAGGFECVGYCEIDKYAKKAYETLYDTKGEVYYDDARKINPNELPNLDLICGEITKHRFYRKNHSNCYKCCDFLVPDKLKFIL